jgi:glycosyltransferase involved in cell wall biosynthesis
MKVSYSLDLSVVIPVGNLENDFENIVSVAEESQEYGIQIVFVLDKQTNENREALIRKINDNNWQDILVQSGDWGNPGSARNIGLTLCSRTFIAFWDSDDKPDFQGIRELLHEIEGDKYDAGIGRFRVSKNKSICLEIGVDDRAKLENFTERIVSNPGIWRFVFRRNFIEKVLFPNYSSAEDQLFLQRFFALEPRIWVSDRAVYTYVHGGSNQLTKSNKVSGQTAQVVKSGIFEFSKLKVKNQNLIDALIMKQILTVAKFGTGKEKLSGMYLALQYFRMFGIGRVFAAQKLVVKAKFHSYFHQKSRVNLILMGGLGNQLFQLAFAYYLREFTGKAMFIVDSNKSIRRSENGEPEIMLYGEVLKRDLKRFGFFSGLVDRGHGLLLRMKLRPTTLKILLFPIPKFIINVISSLKYKQPMLTYVAPDIGYIEWQPRSVSQTVIGYFQTYKYMSYPQVLQALMDLSPKLIESEVSEFRKLQFVESPLLVHIRLGDYRNEPSFGLLPYSYYHDAIKRQMKNGLCRKIWVFSDEIHEYEIYIPKQYLKDVRLIGSVGSNSVSLLEVMRMCKGYVLANSTLSWWAASLSYTDDPVVMYPDPWFEGSRTPTDLTSPNWVAVSRGSC